MHALIKKDTPTKVECYKYTRELLHHFVVSVMLQLIRHSTAVPGWLLLECPQ